MTSAKLLRIFDGILPLLVLLFGVVSAYAIFVLAPPEATMGVVQKTLYFHVGAAFATYLGLGIVFIAAVCFFTFDRREFIMIVKAGSSASFLFASIVLITGMIWGYSSWGTWWRWEPRLVTMLILWLFLLSMRFLLFQKFKNEREEGIIFSVLGILSTLQVPIVMYSIKLLDRTEQLHPEVIAKQGLTAWEYKFALIVTSVSLLFLTGWFVRLQYLLETLVTKTRLEKRSIIKHEVLEEEKCRKQG